MLLDHKHEILVLCVTELRIFYRSVGIVRSRTKAKEFVLFVCKIRRALLHITLWFRQKILRKIQKCHTSV